MTEEIDKNQESPVDRVRKAQLVKNENHQKNRERLQIDKDTNSRDVQRESDERDDNKSRKFNSETHKISKFQKLCNTEKFIWFTKNDYKNNAYADTIMIGMVDGGVLGDDEFSIQYGINYPLILDGGYVLFHKNDSGEDICEKVKTLSKAFPTKLHGSGRVLGHSLRDVLAIKRVSDLSRTQTIGLLWFIGYELLPKEQCGEYTLDHVVRVLTDYLQKNRSKLKSGRLAGKYNDSLKAIISGIYNSMIDERIDITARTAHMSVSNHYIMSDKREDITDALDIFLIQGSAFYLDTILCMRALIEFDSVDDNTKREYRTIISNFCEDVLNVATMLNIDLALKYRRE